MTPPGSRGGCSASESVPEDFFEVHRDGGALCRDGCRPLVPLGFESVTHIHAWKPRKKWIDRSGAVLLKYVSEVTFGEVGITPSMLLEAVSEQCHSGDVSHRMNPRRDPEPQVLSLL